MTWQKNLRKHAAAHRRRLFHEIFAWPGRDTPVTNDRNQTEKLILTIRKTFQILCRALGPVALWATERSMTKEQYNCALKKLKLSHLQFCKLIGKYDARWERSGVKGPSAILLCLLVQGRLGRKDIAACRKFDDEQDQRYYYDRLQLLGR